METLDTSAVITKINIILKDPESIRTYVLRQRLMGTFVNLNRRGRAFRGKYCKIGP